MHYAAASRLIEAAAFMSSSAFQRREQLRALYGFDFPDDLLRFWEFVNRLQPLDPLRAIRESLDIRLVGPFEALSGRFDRCAPRLSPLLHWRYYLDPPEFFTVFSGGGDGLHWGYFLDDPASGEGCVAYYYAADVFEVAVCGDTLFEAVRLELEETYRTCQEDRTYFPQNTDDYEGAMRALDALRPKLCQYATGRRRETGDAYVEKYQGLAARNDRIVAETVEGLGIVAPAETYRPLSLPDKKLRSLLQKQHNPVGPVEVARQALRDGFPATALKLGKELWPLHGERKTEYAYELLDAAYAALGRDVLRQVLRTHREHRDLPSVDIFDEESGTGNGHVGGERPT
jgi:hypothetical protein